MNLEKILKPLHKIEADLEKYVDTKSDHMIANEDAIERLTDENLALATEVQSAHKVKGNLQALLGLTQQ